MKFANFEVHITRRRVKNMRLQVTREGTVHLILPSTMSQKKGIAFITQKQHWIQKSLDQQRQKREKASSQKWCFLGKQYQLQLTSTPQKYPVLFQENTIRIHARTPEVARHLFWSFLHQQAQQILPTQLAELSQRMEMPYCRLSLRHQKSRWGSCSAQKNISLNIALMQLPPHLREYVLIHELCHTRQMNHSPRFWDLVAQFCPDWKTCRKQLRQYNL